MNKTSDIGRASIKLGSRNEGTKLEKHRKEDSTFQPRRPDEPYKPETGANRAFVQSVPGGQQNTNKSTKRVPTGREQSVVSVPLEIVLGMPWSVAAHLCGCLSWWELLWLCW